MLLLEIFFTEWPNAVVLLSLSAVLQAETISCGMVWLINFCNGNTNYEKSLKSVLLLKSTQSMTTVLSFNPIVLVSGFTGILRCSGAPSLNACPDNVLCRQLEVMVVVSEEQDLQLCQFQPVW